MIQEVLRMSDAIHTPSAGSPREVPAMDIILNRLREVGFAEFASQWMIEALVLTHFLQWVGPTADGTPVVRTPRELVEFIAGPVTSLNTTPSYSRSGPTIRRVGRRHPPGRVFVNAP
jgi:hypothetical protein